MSFLPYSNQFQSTEENTRSTLVLASQCDRLSHQALAWWLALSLSSFTTIHQAVDRWDAALLCRLSSTSTKPDLQLVQYFYRYIHLEAEKRNQFSFVCISLNT